MSRDIASSPEIIAPKDLESPSIIDSLSPPSLVLPRSTSMYSSSVDGADDEGFGDRVPSGSLKMLSLEDGEAGPVEDKNKKKKKKRSRKGKSVAQRGPTAMPRYRGSGFEEFFADPPMTPEEARLEKEELYALDIPFKTRMQSCIQRYRARRRLNTDLTTYFNEYLFLGGVDTSPAAHGGWDPKELEELTPAQRRELMASDTIYDGSAADERFYDGDDQKWVVDFAGVASGFFGNSFVQLTGLEPHRMQDAVMVVDNFLRYVLHHDVCPEYEDDVKDAVQVCDKARVQWPMLSQLLASFPGDFNLAAAELFANLDNNDWCFLDFKRRADFDGRSIFWSAVAVSDNADLFEENCREDMQLVREFECTMEITQVIRPTRRAIERFNTMVFFNGTSQFHLEAIGKIILKEAVIEDEWVHPVVPSPLKSEEMTLFFEDHLLALMVPGMKISMRLGELDSGLHFVKTIRSVVPTFYRFLPQQMMRHFKAPRDNDRPAQSAQDYDGYGQEGVMEYQQGGYQQEGNEQAAYAQGGYQQGGNGQATYEQGGYHQAAYQHGAYQQAAYEQGAYQQAAYEQGAYQPAAYEQEPYAQEPYEQEPYEQEPYEQEPYEQEPYEQEPYAQESYAHGAYEQGGYEQGGYEHVGYGQGNAMVYGQEDGGYRQQGGYEQAYGHGNGNGNGGHFQG